MVLEINGLKLPPSIETTEELFDANLTQKRCVSGRLITKIGQKKWRIIINFDTTAFSIDYQKQFYELCFKAKTEPVSICFISPYDGEEKVVIAANTQVQTPKTLGLLGKKPHLYCEIGAEFEEV